MKDTVLSVRDLSVDFGSRRVVREVSLHIPRGECCALVGESGSGKTMTALAINSLLPPGARSSGGITFSDGRREVQLDLLSPKEMRRIRGAGISTVFQDPAAALTPTMRIGAMLRETLRAHGKMSRAEERERSLEALRNVGIPSPEEALRRYPHQFSGGQRQRIVIAGAVICRPRLIIADEPTTALDVLAQAKIMEIFAELTRRGASVMLITHNLALCRKLCGYVNVMYAGQIVERGHTADVFAAPAHPYTQALLRCIPIPGDRTPLREIPPAREGIREGWCPFYPRCPYGGEGCRGGMIEEREVSEGHFSRCVRSRILK